MASRTNLRFARIARETVQQRVYSALRDQLMRGGFEPGQKLKIAELAEAFAGSRGSESIDGGAGAGNPAKQDGLRAGLVEGRVAGLAGNTVCHRGTGDLAGGVEHDR